MRILVCVAAVMVMTAACSSSSTSGSDSASPDGSTTVAVVDSGVEPTAEDSGSHDCKTKAYCPSDWACGEFPDGCGGTVYCGTSTATGCSSDAYSQCGVVTPNKCSACQAGGAGTCPAGESVYTCPSLDELPNGCHVVGRDIDAGVSGYACCVTK